MLTDIHGVVAGGELDDDHPLSLVNSQIEGLLEGDGASEDHKDVIQFLLETGLPRSTVDRVHRAIVCAEKPGSESDYEVTPQMIEAGAPAARDYIDGIKIPDLQRALTWFGVASEESHEWVAAKMAEHINGLTYAVLRHKEAFDAERSLQAAAQVKPAVPTDQILAAFDAAVAAELPRVSHLEYDSHEICKHFAGRIRAVLAAAQAKPIDPPHERGRG